MLLKMTVVEDVIITEEAQAEVLEAGRFSSKKRRAFLKT
jgi:hypothetical protein